MGCHQRRRGGARAFLLLSPVFAFNIFLYFASGSGFERPGGAPSWKLAMFFLIAVFFLWFPPSSSFQLRRCPISIFDRQSFNLSINDDHLPFGSERLFPERLWTFSALRLWAPEKWENGMAT